MPSVNNAGLLFWVSARGSGAPGLSTEGAMAGGDLWAFVLGARTYRS
jgi:hypothetical protein